MKPLMQSILELEERLKDCEVHLHNVEASRRRLVGGVCVAAIVLASLTLLGTKNIEKHEIHDVLRTKKLEIVSDSGLAVAEILSDAEGDASLKMRNRNGLLLIEMVQKSASAEHGPEIRLYRPNGEKVGTSLTAGKAVFSSKTDEVIIQNGIFLYREDIETPEISLFLGDKGGVLSLKNIAGKTEAMIYVQDGGKLLLIKENDLVDADIFLGHGPVGDTPFLRIRHNRQEVAFLGGKKFGVLKLFQDGQLNREIP